MEWSKMLNVFLDINDLIVRKGWQLTSEDGDILVLFKEGEELRFESFEELQVFLKNIDLHLQCKSQ